MTKQKSSYKLDIFTEKLVKYQDLITVASGTSTEDFVCLTRDKNASVFGDYDKFNDMQTLLPHIPVRKTVAKKLSLVAKDLKNINGKFSLRVTYGYRSLAIQKKYFKKQSQEMFNRLFLTVEEKEKIHKMIAVPDVAGHPTGGAVDVTIVDVDSGLELDMGSMIYDLTSINMPVFSQTIDAKQKNNRFLLRKLMMNQGFAPFDGEWWHFSYGDKEWAFYYGERKSIYSQVNLTKLKPFTNKFVMR